MVEWCLGNLEDGFFDIKFICLHFWKDFFHLQQMKQKD